MYSIFVENTVMKMHKRTRLTPLDGQRCGGYIKATSGQSAIKPSITESAARPSTTSSNKPVSTVCTERQQQSVLSHSAIRFKTYDQSWVAYTRTTQTWSKTLQQILSWRTGALWYQTPAFAQRTNAEREYNALISYKAAFEIKHTTIRDRISFTRFSSRLS